MRQGLAMGDVKETPESFDIPANSEREVKGSTESPNVSDEMLGNSELDLDRLLELRRAGTRNPWSGEHKSWAGPNAIVNGDGHPIAVFGEDVPENNHFQASADRVLVVAAVNSLVPLIERVKDLEEVEKDLLEQDERNLAEMSELADERDSAREIAVALEQQLCRIQELHKPAHPPYCDPRCIRCDSLWPCATVRALDGGGA